MLQQIKKSVQLVNKSFTYFIGYKVSGINDKNLSCIAVLKQYAVSVFIVLLKTCVNPANKSN